MAKKVRKMMYSPAVSMLPSGVEGLHEDLDKLFDGSRKGRYCYALHDDTDHDHLSVSMEFNNPRYVTAVAKALHANSHDIVTFDKLSRNPSGTLFSYPAHLTWDASAHKHVFDVEGLVANFDIQSYLLKVSHQIEKRSTSIDKALKLYASGDISDSELLDKIGVYAYDVYRKRINNYQKLSAQREHNKYLTDYAGCKIKSLLLTGPCDHDKKMDIAKKVLKNQSSVAILTADGGYLSHYHGERGVIVVLPDREYFRDRKSAYRFWVETILKDPSLLDRKGYDKRREVLLNLEYIIFVCDTEFHSMPVLGLYKKDTHYLNIDPVVKTVDNDDEYDDLLTSLEKRQKKN